MSPPIPIIIVGGAGRMGSSLRELASQDGAGLTVAALVDEGDDLTDAIHQTGAQCVIDFSVLAQVQTTLSACAAARVPLVLGTTGLEEADRAALQETAKTLPVVWAPNFSVGVTALFSLVRDVKAVLGQGWDAEIVESHHRHKVDAPSGTARRLAELLMNEHGPSGTTVVGREGLTGPRTRDEVGVSVVRGGDVVGEHEVRFMAEGEQVVLTHRATDRDIFARGALRAARWVAADGGQEPGLYDMTDVLAGS